MRVLADAIAPERLAIHLHDTRGMAVANAWAALEAGIRRFDASVGGIGGCPFAPGAAGNLATEDLVLMAERSGFATGISLDGLLEAIDFAQERLQRYFDAKGPGRWAVKPAIKSRVEFRPLNLLDSYASLGKFDIIFCRNVLIYFSAEVKKDILTRMHSMLKPGGYLFLGASEALNGLPEKYQMVQGSPGSIYKAK